MREIKFRAWEIRNKKMRGVMGFRINDNGSKTWNCTETPQSWEPQCDKTCKEYYGNGDFVMQFTGLKDKNGKEIYEGDIVCFEIDSVSYIGEIKFELGSFIIACHELEDSYTYFSTFDCEDNCLWEMRVIHNIYEEREEMRKKTGSGKE